MKSTLRGLVAAEGREGFSHSGQSRRRGGAASAPPGALGSSPLNTALGCSPSPPRRSATMGAWKRNYQSCDPNCSRAFSGSESGCRARKAAAITVALWGLDKKHRWAQPPRFENLLTVFTLLAALCAAVTIAKAIHDLIAAYSGERLAWPIAAVLAWPIAILACFIVSLA